jgi:hypothetical protein
MRAENRNLARAQLSSFSCGEPPASRAQLCARRGRTVSEVAKMTRPLDDQNEYERRTMSRELASSRAPKERRTVRDTSALVPTQYVYLWI